MQQRQGTQGRRRGIAGKQSGRGAQGTQGQRRGLDRKQQVRGGGGNQNVRKNTRTGSKGRFGGAKVTANRLKNKQGSLQKVSSFCICFGCSAFFHVNFLSIQNHLFPEKLALL